MLINKQIKSRVDLIISNIAEHLNLDLDHSLEDRDIKLYLLTIEGLYLLLSYIPLLFYIIRRTDDYYLKKHFTLSNIKVLELYNYLLEFFEYQDDYINKNILLEIIDLINMITPPEKTYSIEEIMNIYSKPDS